MKKLPFIILLFFVFTANAQHSLKELWRTDTVMLIPESVLPDFKTKMLFVSQIDGPAWEKDGKGGIGKIGADGKIINLNWITGLNAPKGLARVKNKLYVADLSEVVVIDIKKGIIDQKIAIDSASGLNDVTVDSKGVIYVSDSKTGKIHQIKNNKALVYLRGMKGVNGLKSVGTDLYILSGTSFIKTDNNKQITQIANLPFGGDGLEPLGNGDFIATSWSGLIYYIYKDGHFDTLLDTSKQGSNTADIGFDPVKRIIYVPTFNKKRVVAYQLN